MVKNRSFCAGAATPRFKGSLSHAGVAVQCAAARWRAAAVRGRGVGTVLARGAGGRVGCCYVAVLAVAFRFHGFTGDSARRAVPSRIGPATRRYPAAKHGHAKTATPNILSYSFVPPRAQHLSHGSSAQSPHTTHTAHDLGSVHSALALSSPLLYLVAAP
jgi:hypothetical protein